MNPRKVRNALLLGVAAVSASLEAPRLQRQPLAAAATELTGGPAAIVSTAKHVVANVTESHLGFDTNIYPGDHAMDAWKASGEYEWVGYYLKAPCHSDTSWSGKRARLANSGWGLAVIYVGQQTWGNNYRTVTTTKRVMVRERISRKSRKTRKVYVTRRMTRQSHIPVATSADGCSASFVNDGQGRIDARDAIARAEREGFARGSVLFLDVEYMDEMPQRMRDYYRAWTAELLVDGRFRPGIYTHTHNARQIYDDVSDIYDDAGVADEPPFWVAGAGGFAPDRTPADVGHHFASVWQGMLDVVRSHNGVKLPIDISVASVSSPSAVQ